MSGRNCSEAFEKKCKDGLFGPFCEFKCPGNCERDNDEGSCDRLEGTCDDFDKEQNAVLTASEYWYLFVAAAVGLVVLLFCIYFFDWVCSKRKRKNQARRSTVGRESIVNNRKPSKTKQISTVEKNQQPYIDALTASKTDQPESTFEEPTIDNRVEPSYQTDSVPDTSKPNPNSISHVVSDNSALLNDRGKQADKSASRSGSKNDVKIDKLPNTESETKV